MSPVDDSEQFKPVLPRRLNEVITRNRDLFTLSLATAQQISAITRIILPVLPEVQRGAVSDWRLITFQLTLPNEPPQTHIHLLGNNYAKSVGTKITNHLVGIDFGTRLVATKSGSIYGLIGPQGVGEPTLEQLCLVCRALWSWGQGELLGVLRIYY